MLISKGLQNSFHGQILSPDYQETCVRDLNQNLVRLTIPERSADPPTYDSLFNEHKL